MPNKEPHRDGNLTKIEGLVGVARIDLEKQTFCKPLPDRSFPNYPEGKNGSNLGVTKFKRKVSILKNTADMPSSIPRMNSILNNDSNRKN
jgi:hypothetical protein